MNAYYAYYECIPLGLEGKYHPLNKKINPGQSSPCIKRANIYTGGLMRAGTCRRKPKVL
jgi:hypothetical protein